MKRYKKVHVRETGSNATRPEPPNSITKNTITSCEFGDVPKKRKSKNDCNHNYRIVESNIVTAHADNEEFEKRVEVLFHCTRCLELKMKVETMKGV